jgi:hypothetical protein
MSCYITNDKSERTIADDRYKIQGKNTAARLENNMRNILFRSMAAASLAIPL